MDHLKGERRRSGIASFGFVQRHIWELWSRERERNQNTRRFTRKVARYSHAISYFRFCLCSSNGKYEHQFQYASLVGSCFTIQIYRRLAKPMTYWWQGWGLLVSYFGPLFLSTGLTKFLAPAKLKPSLSQPIESMCRCQKHNHYQSDYKSGLHILSTHSRYKEQLHDVFRKAVMNLSIKMGNERLNFLLEFTNHLINRELSLNMWKMGFKPSQFGNHGW